MTSESSKDGLEQYETVVRGSDPGRSHPVGTLEFMYFNLVRSRFEKDPESAMKYVQSSLGLTDENATRVIEYVQFALDASNEKSAAEIRAVCQRNSAISTRTEIGSVFQSIDDAVQSENRRLAQGFLDMLDLEGKSKWEAWVDAHAGNVTSIQMDYQALMQDDRVDAFDFLDRLCEPYTGAKQK